MNHPSRRTLLALALVAAPVAVIPFIVPESPLAHLGLTHHIALVAYVFLVIVLAVLHLFAKPEHLTRIERILLGLFLFAMPVVYLADWQMSRGTIDWLFIELVGQIIFGVTAVMGIRRRPWLIAAGIVAHGVLWDSWHCCSGSTTPHWYAMGCLLADLGLGGYYAVRLHAPVTLSLCG